MILQIRIKFDMKKIKTNSFYDFLLMFCLGLYILGCFAIRRLVSNTFKFVYIKYNFNIFLFVISLIFVTINLCIFLNKRRNKFRNQNKKKTKNNEWGRDFLIFFRIFYFFSMLIIFLSILNIVFSRNELDFKLEAKHQRPLRPAYRNKPAARRKCIVGICGKIRNA